MHISFVFTTICLHLFCSTFVQPIFPFIYKNSAYYSFLFIHLFLVSKNKTFVYLFCSLLFFFALTLVSYHTPIFLVLKNRSTNFMFIYKNSSSYVLDFKNRSTKFLFIYRFLFTPPCVGFQKIVQPYFLFIYIFCSHPYIFWFIPLFFWFILLVSVHTPILLVFKICSTNFLFILQN